MVSKQPSHTTQTTKVELPAWVDKASQDNYALAEKLGSKPFMQYGGDRVASMSDATQAGINGVRDKIASGDMTGIMSKIADGTISIGNTDMSKYMNPYTTEVIDKSLSAVDDKRRQALMGNSDAAAKAKAFGGSRHGIIDGVTNAESLKDMGLIASQLRSDGYKTALASASTDINNQGAMAQGTIDARTKELAALMQTGMMEKGQGQEEINAAIQKFNEPRDYDLENLNLRLSALGMSPYGKSEQTDKQTTGGSSGTDFGQLGMGIFSLLLGLSEDDEKTDKKKLGKLPNTDLDLWAYRYKGDPKSYPKVVGPMASDVEKKMPHLVSKVGGKRIIDFAPIMAMAKGA
jgi:hypothetical protein